MQQEPSASDSSVHLDRDGGQSQLVRSLREQAHRAFLQINQMEKFGRMEVEHLRLQFQDCEKEWLRKEQQLKAQVADLENKLKQNEQSSKCAPVIIDLGDFDDSHFFDQIEHVSESLRDSGIEKLQQWLTENQKSPTDELDERTKTIQTLQAAIVSETNYISQSTLEIIKLCKELCIQACNLKEQLKNFIDTNEVSKCKIQEAYGLLSKYKLNQSRFKTEANDLKQQSKYWRNLYQNEVGQKQEVQNTLIMLQQKVIVNESQNIKLHEIIKDQSSQLEQLNREQSSLNDNIEINDSNSQASKDNVSNLSTSTLSNFLQRTRKQPIKNERASKAELRFSYRTPCEPPTITSLFKKKPFLMRKGQN